ncbi:MAG: hypothetical protein PHR06_14960, partial [Candidatus Cloacimonetes bacterium]|nr:hypothetical protein [Candidatus Cloacimonadota bacterium]
MEEKLKTLILMQKYDDIITQKDDLKIKLPEELKSLQDNSKSAEIVVNEVKIKLENNSVNQKKKELEKTTNFQNIQKYEGQLLNIKTNKEYKALNSEIATLKQKNTAIDDE